MYQSVSQSVSEVSGTSPSSMIKNLQSNYEMNTGHVNTIKHSPESCNLGLSNTSKNANNGPV